MNVSINNGLAPSDVIRDSVTITAIPAGIMLLGSIVTIYWPSPPPKNVAHAIQHFAAGILLSAIALELIPPIASAKQMISILGMIVGFSLGTIVMISLPLLVDEREEDVASAVEMEAINKEAGCLNRDVHEISDRDELQRGEHIREAAHIHSPPYCPPAPEEIELKCSEDELPADIATGEEGQGLPSSAEGASELEDQTNVRQQFSPYSMYSYAQRVLLRRRNSLQQLFRRCPINDDACSESAGCPILCETKMKFPHTFAIAVYVDCVIDGLLVGVSLITGTSAGLFMAVAMALEMGFLGLSFAAAVRLQPKWTSIPAVLLGPALMMIGAAVGGVIANIFAYNEPLLVGCLSFGVAALLYMVSEELLVSAHEDGFGHCWWVDVQVFVGFLVAMVVGMMLQRVAH